MAETLNDDVLSSKLYELPDGSRIRKTVTKANPDYGDPGGTSYVLSTPPSALNIQDEALKSFMEFLIINPAIESQPETLEKGIFPDHFEFKVLFAPLNDPKRERTQAISLKGYIDEAEESGFKLQFTPENQFTESLKKIFLLGHKRIVNSGVVRLLTKAEFEELVKNAKEIPEPNG